MFEMFIKLTRMYALPMSIFSWFVAYCYALVKYGDITNGLISLIGICLAHLGINVFDDYVDYKSLRKGVDEDNNPILINAQTGKCEYLLKGIITPNQVLALVLVFLILASLVGFYFVLKIGFGVLVFMVLAGILGIAYPFLGKCRLCEFALALIYGPILFGGVYYVMTGHYDWRTIIVSIPTMLMTLNMLFTDTMLDYDLDIAEGKKTIANLFPTKWDGWNFQKCLIALAYISVVLMTILKIGGWEIFLTIGTLPLAINLLDSMKIYVINNSELFDKNEEFLGHWNELSKDTSAMFMLRMYQARNLMICFSLVFGLALLLNR